MDLFLLLVFLFVVKREGIIPIWCLLVIVAMSVEVSSESAQASLRLRILHKE